MSNSSRLEHHIIRCQTQLYKLSWKIFRSVETSEFQSSSEYAEMHDKTSNTDHDLLIQAEQADDTWEMSMKMHTYEIETSETLYIFDDIDYTNLHIKSTSCILDDEQMLRWMKHQWSQHNLLSISSSIQVKSYQETISYSVDTVLNTQKKHSHLTDWLLSERNSNMKIMNYYSFQSKTDYDYTLWLHETHTTNRSVNKFFKDLWMSSMHSLLSFKNADRYIDKLHQISYDISEEEEKQEWRSQIFTVESVYDEITDQKYIIQYYDVIDTLCFLLDHQSFYNNLIYASVQHYNDDAKWVYSEMHTEEWWWQTQTELLSSVTLVSLLISIDKTMLTQHQSDISVWLIYLTIENLNWHTRQNQTQSELILLDFLLQVENDDNNIKSRVWHIVLSIILKCVFTLMWCFILLSLLIISSNWDHCETRL